MQRLLHTLPCFLILLCSTAIAGGQTVPTLKEWFKISVEDAWTVSGPLVYLPNFDTANGGYHATAMYVHRSGHPNGSGEVWYHQYYLDTVKRYDLRWISTNAKQVDFDGDGVLDYISGFGNVVRGIKNGSPPEDELSARYDWIIGEYNPYTVADLNEDGKQDVIANLNGVGGGRMFSVLVGGSDLKNLKYTLVRPRGKEAFIGVLKKRGDNGTWRYISMRHEFDNDDKPIWTSLILNEMSVWMQDDSLHISLKTLDSISLNTQETGWHYGYRQSGIYEFNHTNKEYLFITEYYKGNSGHLTAFDLETDTFRQITRFGTYNSSLDILNADVNGDGYNDWAVRDWDYIYLYAGQREGVDSIPFGRYRLPCTDQIDYLHAIGDVNNDGVRDLAVALSPNAGIEGCFGMFLGTKRRTVDVDEPAPGYTEVGFDMLQNYPNPVGRDRTTTIPIAAERPQHLTLELWALDGQYIGTLRDGWTAGVQEIDVSLLQYQLPAGIYVLRLRGINGIRERAIMLE